MRRVNELLSRVRDAHPDDPFFRDFAASLKAWPLKRRYYAAYERAFSYLDEASWTNLQSKAVKHFHEKRYLQLKGPFFDQLNDAIAYKWLVDRGFTEVSVLPEDQRGRTSGKCPDLSFLGQGRQFYCDVKTIANSREELDRRIATARYHDRSQYALLHATFFRKIDDAIVRGTEQIRACGQRGLIFILVNFDDFTMTYHQQYRTQVASHLRRHSAAAVVVKFGVFGLRPIERVSFLFNQSGA